MPLSHHGLTTVTHSYTVRLHLTSPARLQRLHNTAAMLIMRCPLSDNATPLLRELHWLPIVCRIDFKLFTYKAMHNDAPVYLCELVCPYQPTRTLRSANNNMLEVTRTRTKARDCSFAVASASLWINLPTVIKTRDNLTSFKRLTKTHFFHIHISVIRQEHYYFLLDYLVILSIYNYNKKLFSIFVNGILNGIHSEYH